MSEPNLKELWERRAEDERSGKSPEERDFGIFDEISAQAELSGDLKGYFGDLKDAIVRYGELVATYERHLGTENVSRADESRRITHNALVDKLNILSRESVKAGLDNSWRKDIGDSREQIGEWAKHVAGMLQKMPV